MLVEKITQAFECKKKAFGVFLDLSNAFDTIDSTKYSYLNYIIVALEV